MSNVVKRKKLTKRIALRIPHATWRRLVKQARLHAITPRELVREALMTQPPKPGAEWPLLLHLADDADDGTRWTACGVEYMMGRTHAPKSTVMRWLKTLRESGLKSIHEGLTSIEEIVRETVLDET